MCLALALQRAHKGGRCSYTIIDVRSQTEEISCVLDVVKHVDLIHVCSMVLLEAPKPPSGLFASLCSGPVRRVLGRCLYLCQYMYLPHFETVSDLYVFGT